MAIVTALCDSAKEEFLKGIHLSSHTYKLALYQSSASLDATTTAYTATGEITGTNYTAGGAALTGPTFGVADGVGYMDFSDLTFTNITANQPIGGCMIYNDTLAGNNAVCTILFPTTFSPVAEDFKLFIPSGGTGLIRIG